MFLMSTNVLIFMLEIKHWDFFIFFFITSTFFSSFFSSSNNSGSSSNNSSSFLQHLPTLPFPFFRFLLHLKRFNYLLLNPLVFLPLHSHFQLTNFLHSLFPFLKSLLLFLQILNCILKTRKMLLSNLFFPLSIPQMPLLMDLQSTLLRFKSLNLIQESHLFFLFLCKFCKNRVENPLY